MSENIKLTKLPPQSLENEMAVIGSMIRDNMCISEVATVLNKDDFYANKHAELFLRIVIMHRLGQPTDIATLIASLDSQNILDKIGGPAYLSQLTESTPSPKSVMAYAEIVAQMSIYRQMIMAGNDIVNKAYNHNGDFSEFLDASEKKLLEITRIKSLKACEDRIGKYTKTTFACAELVYNNLLEHMANKDLMRGIPTGFKKLDMLTEGYRPKDLITLAGRPGTGKSSIAAQFADFHACAGGRPLILSREMSAESIIRRIAGQRTFIPERNISSGKISEDEAKIVKSALDDIANTNLMINDRPGKTIEEILFTMRQSLKKHSHTVIIFDNYQTITNNTKQPQNYFIQSCVKQFEDFAGEFDIPIIGISHVGRGLEKTGVDKRPTLSDLKDSGAVEQTSAVVIFVHRPDAYLHNGSDLCEMVVGKNRWGPCAVIPMCFNREFCYFEEKRLAGEEDGD